MAASSSRMTENRATGSSMPADTSTRAGVKALPPAEPSVRVLTGMEIRSWSTGWPAARW